MNQGQEKQHRSGDSGKKSRLDSLILKRGESQITVTEGALPEFLVKANAAARSWQFEKASEFLNDQNIQIIARMVERDRSRTDIMFILAKVLFEANRVQEAEHWYKKILETEFHPLVYKNLGQVYENRCEFSRAIECIKKALEAEPDNADFLVALGEDLIDIGKTQEGIELLRKAIESRSGFAAAESSLMWNLHYSPETNLQQLFVEYKKWGSTYAPMSMARKSHDNAPDPDRRLRIGYISPDFRTNSASRSFEPFLDGHDRQQFEICGYGNIMKPDEITDRFKDKFDYYRSINPMEIEEAANLIEQDKIDILVEIGGHCRGNCLGVLARKPAPVQVDYGGINTLGMEQIDYRFTDSIMDPPHLEKFYVEESVYLPGGFCVYRPPHNSPLVCPLPAKEKGYITFGSFNDHRKVNQYTMELWAKILKAVENSRLLLKFRAGNDPRAREHFFSQFEQLGINRQRVEISGMLNSHFEHMQLYGQLDLALDTYPFNGCITTLEGLWMGVPIVTLVGKQGILSRVGLSILSRLEFEIFAAAEPDEYVAKAIAFANEPENLEKIRFDLRRRMLASTLCSPGRFATDIEAAYRKMWHRWCRSQGVDVPDGQAACGQAVGKS